MRTYLYTANDERGIPITKQVRATDRQEAMDQLRDRGYTHIKLRDVSAAVYADASATLITPGLPDEDVAFAGDVPPLEDLLSPPDAAAVDELLSPPDAPAVEGGPHEVLLPPVEMRAVEPRPLPFLCVSSDRPAWAYPETINFLRVLPTCPVAAQ